MEAVENDIFLASVGRKDGLSRNQLYVLLNPRWVKRPGPKTLRRSGNMRNQEKIRPWTDPGTCHVPLMPILGRKKNIFFRNRRTLKEKTLELPGDTPPRHQKQPNNKRKKKKKLRPLGGDGGSQGLEVVGRGIPFVIATRGRVKG